MSIDELKEDLMHIQFRVECMLQELERMHNNKENFVQKPSREYLEG